MEGRELYTKTMCEQDVTKIEPGEELSLVGLQWRVDMGQMHRFRE